MITEAMAAALVDAAFDGLGDLVERSVAARRASACWREQKWIALIEMTNTYRIANGRRPRLQPLRNAYRIHASASCKASKVTCDAVSSAVRRKLAEAKDRIAKGTYITQGVV